MKRTALTFLLLPILLFLSFTQAAGAPADSETLVFVIPVSGTISPGLASFVLKNLEHANELGANAVLLEIDTLGGLVQAALDIRDALLAAPLPVHAYVKGRAWSAGALITLACDRILMSPGSSIGSAEPRPADAKSISALRAEFESTAEAKGRDKLLAAAMVDQSVIVEDVKEKGQLLNLSATQAVELGMADDIAMGLDRAVDWLGLTEPRVESASRTFWDDVACVLTEPSVSALLATIGAVGLTIEIIRPGFGVPGVVGLLSFGALLAGRTISRVAGAESALLFLGGLILLSIEAFIPGFGLLGVSGVILVVVGIVFAVKAAVSLRSALLSLAISLLAVAAIARYAAKRGVWARLALDRTLKQESQERAFAAKAGAIGVAVSPLRPSGTAEFGGNRFSVVTSGEFLDAGTQLVVKSVYGNRIVVRSTNERTDD